MALLVITVDSNLRVIDKKSYNNSIIIEETKYHRYLNEDHAGTYDSLKEALDVAHNWNGKPIKIFSDKYNLSSLLRCPYLTGIRVKTKSGTGTYEIPNAKKFAKLISNITVVGNDETISLVNESENQYLSILTKLIDKNVRPNRTNIGTRGSFLELIKFPLSDIGGKILPLLTTKKVPVNSIFEELCMFVLAETDTKRLDAKNIPIWKGNTSREFLDSRGLDYPVGTLGPIYGFQWRKFGADWTDPNSTGVDQLQKAINTLMTDPGDRRMLVVAWNPLDLDKCVLPPCHYSFQFHCDFDENLKPCALNCVVNMRSADLALGVPFNIASYAILTHAVSTIVNIPAGTLALVMADCHIYENHIDGIKEQISRTPKRFPYITTNAIKSIDDISQFKFMIHNYDADPHIKLPMAV